MAELSFQSLAARDRREALRAAQEASGLRAFLLEKDIWVVQTLRVLFDLPFGADIVFKGGTSLAKAYGQSAASRKISTLPTTSAPSHRTS